MTKAELIAVYTDYLKAEGYGPSYDEDRDIIVFKKEGGSYWIQIVEADPTYFRLIFPKFWSANNEAERSIFLAAANQTMRVTKAVKVTLEASGTASALVEQFLPSTHSFKTIFVRAITAIQTGVEKTLAELPKLPQVQESTAEQNQVVKNPL